ncbi:SIR2 family protein [Pantoea cypripedii]|uniref:SIR2 family protein n=1 Tax=Pantoea cypripedii TaxID=55209 RepID=A0A6B9FZ55_PANCY|nr:SIR2 family protein [Pantoea cypripedii]QGY30234.1 SIR2 family protein [Pantoea cypripedii]
MDIDAIKLYLQQFFSNSPTVLIGSGLSLGEGISGMGALANHLNLTIPKLIGGELVEEWEIISTKLRDGMGLEDAMAFLKDESKLIPLIVSNTAELILKDESSVICSVINGEKKLALTSLLSHLTFNQDELVIITPNYDRLIELACEYAEFEVATGFINSYYCSNSPDLDLHKFRTIETRRSKSGKPEAIIRTKKHVRIFKPHGSLDWFKADNKVIRTSFNNNHERLIITPGTSKFRAGYQQPFDWHREKANHHIKRANSLLIIGYGFNDEQLEVHLKSKIRDKIPVLLITYGLTPNAQKTCDENPCITYIIAEKENSIVCINGEKYKFEKKIWSLNEFVNEVLI